MSSTTYPVNPGWRILLADLGIRPANVLRRAGLPDDLFGRDKASLTADEWFGLWGGIEAESGDPKLPIVLGSGISVEAFDPPIFAALCSPDLNTALRRLAHYKRLIMPMALHVDATDQATRLTLEWLEASAAPPVALMATELVFFVQLARIATRERIVPAEVTALHVPEPRAAYTEYFGVPVRKGPAVALSFGPADATRPFLTANEAMWRFFEPDLQRRLSKLDASASMVDRVRAALLELLPGGLTDLATVARKLGMSQRTVQRRLKEQGSSFREVLNATRERVARHYLHRSELTGAEISFLLGYEDPNSFFRAFHTWTGQTPEQTRRDLRAGS